MIIEWNEGEKEIYITGGFYKNNKLYLSSNEKIYKYYFRLNSKLINSLNGIKFEAKGKMKISSIFIINNSNSKTIKNKDNSQTTSESSLISAPKKYGAIINFTFSKKIIVIIYQKEMK